SHAIMYEGTSFFIVESHGTAGPGGEPSSAPAVYCGTYPMDAPEGNCGLPMPLANLTSVNTGWLWEHTGVGQDYSAQYEIVLAAEFQISSYVQVWLSEGPEHQPIGSATSQQ